jgi:RNA polymerase sigma-70 factor, ECF subfamily
VSGPASARAAGSGDEKRLFSRVANRDAGALRTLYDRHASRALAIAVRILRAQSEAEEVVQETFLELWKRAPDFDPERGSASSWIASIARSRSIDRLRSRGSAERTVRTMSDESLAELPPSPLENVEQRLWREKIQAALATLPPEQRLVLEQAYFEGLTQREIAAKTGEPLGTIKTRVRLALEKLTALLGGSK